MDDALPTFRLAPKPVNVSYIWTNPTDWKFEKTLTLRGSKKNPLFLRQSVADIPAADSRPSWLTPAEPLDIIFGGFRLHADVRGNMPQI